MLNAFKELAKNITGEFRFDEPYCSLYAQDASVYQKKPVAVCIPKLDEDIAEVLGFARKHNFSIIPRTGGTSLAGQLVGESIILDMSKYYRTIISIDPEQRTAVVQAGVIRNDLNKELKKYDLFFAPETSTTSSCTISGMVGNNACGTRSIFYGTTREHIRSIKGFLSDGSSFNFSPLSQKELASFKQNKGLEGEIYRDIDALIKKHETTIKEAQPNASLIRDNSGYALNTLLQKGEGFNLSRLICGSEGTLAIITEVTVSLSELPKHTGIICAHFHSLSEAFKAVPKILEHHPSAIELFDRSTLNASKNNSEQSRNRFWIEDNPEAVQVIECIANDAHDLKRKLQTISEALSNTAYALPILHANEMEKVWNLRKASLGLLMGEKENKKAVAVIEDAAIPIPHLLDYVVQMQEYAKQNNIDLVIYGHASVGVIHMRPKLDLEITDDKLLFEKIAQYSAELVKQYNGSISGEHGDGRLRSKWLPWIHGKEYHQLLIKVKHLFDPNNRLNPGKITQIQPLVEDFRPTLSTEFNKEVRFNWEKESSFSAAIQKCNGSGACRKSDGLMCPSFQATQEESLSTRGRANLLRHIFSAKDPKALFNLPLIKEALDTCLSCKACKTECPASVDMAKIKSEFLNLRATKGMLSGQEKRQRMAIKKFPFLLKLQSSQPIFSHIANLNVIKKLLGVDPQRNFPHAVKPFHSQWESLQSALQKALPEKEQLRPIGLIIDLYSNFYEPHVSIATCKVLNKLGYKIFPVFLTHSPRLLISSGMLLEATEVLMKLRIQMAQLKVDHWIGIEPSETLVFRDDCSDLIGNVLPKVWLLDEFLPTPLSKQEHLKPKDETVYLHTHCHQRTLVKNTAELMLKCIPKIKVKHIESSCCGMAGQFGYQHFQLSKKIAEKGILKCVNGIDKNAIIVTAGTSCRHQFIDLSKHRPIHPIELIVQTLSL